MKLYPSLSSNKLGVLCLVHASKWCHPIIILLWYFPWFRSAVSETNSFREKCKETAFLCVGRWVFSQVFTSPQPFSESWNPSPPHHSSSLAIYFDSEVLNCKGGASQCYNAITHTHVALKLFLKGVWGMQAQRNCMEAHQGTHGSSVASVHAWKNGAEKGKKEREKNKLCLDKNPQSLMPAH